jgi:peptidoglycan/xylan/chitin deacetylase (PgdA/CDA1 family)
MPASLPILTFHALDDQPSVISFPPQLFQRGMARLHDNGWKTLSLPEIVDHANRGISFPERSFAITFDDGYQSVYNRAFPILQGYGFSATVFLTVGENRSRTNSDRLPSMCDRTMLSWNEIKEMHRTGITFGAHTLTHPDLTRLRGDQLEAEVAGAKAVIEDTLGTQVTDFAYPFGRYDDRSREIVSHHFVCACSDKLGLTRIGSDVYAMERVDAYYLRNDRLFDVMLTRIFPSYIRLRSIPRGVRRTIQLGFQWYGKVAHL